MPRKVVTRLRKQCGELAGHSRQQAARVAQAATAMAGDGLREGQETVDLLQFQLSLGEQIHAIRVQLTKIDNLHAHELQVDNTLREERAAATKELRERLFQLRDSLDGLFGTGRSARIFEDKTRIPKDPMELHQFTGHIRDNLTNPQFEMPEPLQPGFQIDREASAEHLEEPYQKLDLTLLTLEGTASDSKYSQSEKDLNVEEVEIFVGKVYRYYEALFDLVGFDRLAKRLRRSRHLREDSDGEAEETGDPKNSEPSEDAAEATTAEATTAKATTAEATTAEATTAEATTAEATTAEATKDAAADLKAAA